MEKILIIGTIPSTAGIGGVTVHVQRLLNWLDAKGVAHTLCDYKILSLKEQIRLIMHHKNVHLHVSHPVLRVMYALLIKLMGKKLIFTLHGNLGRFNRLGNLLDKLTLKLSDIPIVINQNSYKKALNWNKHTQLIPAFIPPQIEEQLQQDILDLMKKIHRDNKKIVSTNAFNVSFDKEGRDTYGIDFLIHFFKNVKDKVLVISDPSGNYHKQYPILKTESVLFIDYPHPFFELLKHVDYFVRNTSTDGDALSVKEALYLGVPTLCSDVVDRPNGAKLFKYCDASSFELCLSAANHTTDSTKIENAAIRIIELYKQL